MNASDVPATFAFRHARVTPNKADDSRGVITRYDCYGDRQCLRDTVNKQIGHVSEVHRVTMLLNRNQTGANKLSSNKSREESGAKPKLVRNRTFIQRATRMTDISDVIVGLPQSVSYLVHPNKPILCC
ncbi:hypothetical protein LSAT2_020781 [Lamellibrachia satsuma]|nr:hypothetical protein LSAT2_020781 [Lamellibrachia satsuma]